MTQVCYAPWDMSDTYPAYVLHALPYKETSLVVEIFTRHQGRLPVVAKGAKRPHSALRSILLSLQPLLVKYTGKGEVKNLTHAEWAGGHLPPEGQGLLAGYYLNELMMRFFQREDPHPELFDVYMRTLAQLASGYSVAQAVRTFELSALESMGFGLDLSGDWQGTEFDPQAFYQWSDGQGFLKQTQPAASRASGFMGDLLITLREQGVCSDDMALAIRPLTRQLLSDYSGPYPLMSRTWMEQLKKS